MSGTSSIDVEMPTGTTLSAAQRIPVGTIHISEGPRLTGECAAHTRRMAEAGDELPPIIVHRSSMRVLDGVHRLRVAQLRGETYIDAKYFDGDDRDAYVFAVRANIAHGLPLTKADRFAAAERLLRMYPDWSDRAIADCVGLSHNTLGTLRRRGTERAPQLHDRIGRDGKRRPVDATANRARVATLIAERPTASLRSLAREAGVSPATVRDVRERLRQGEDPLARRTPRQRVSPAATAGSPVDLMDQLRRDPSLRFNDAGRSLLHLISAHPIRPEDWERIASGIPPHCAELVARIAQQNAACWDELANQLRRRQLEEWQMG